ncbi:hypothetical protein [Azohydromonas lata]|uniref:hypothetical protein n=1 Tax=Azohydromonas lata TaxID=45677 RepID=UPI00083347ED|nr:hypothetical protein [Azohydromonas lata]
MQLDPMEIYRRENTPEAQARRRQRRKARGWSQHYPLDRTTDLLALRERSIQRWKDRAAAEADKPQFGLGRFGWVWRIYHHPGFRRLVLPAVRALLDAHDKARKERYQAEARDYDRHCSEKKALDQARNGKPAPSRHALEKAARLRARQPQAQLFD